MSKAGMPFFYAVPVESGLKYFRYSILRKLHLTFNIY